jgi:hypothetical protein
MGRNRSNAATVAVRVDAAAALLADGLPRTAAVSQLAERYRVDRRTARRYVADGAELLAEEIGGTDLAAAMAESVERLHRLAHLAEQRGNLNAAIGAARAAASTLAAVYRVDAMAAAALNGRSLAMPEPTERERRRYRERRGSAGGLPDDYPH